MLFEFLFWYLNYLLHIYVYHRNPNYEGRAMGWENNFWRYCIQICITLSPTKLKSGQFLVNFVLKMSVQKTVKFSGETVSLRYT